MLCFPCCPKHFISFQGCTHNLFVGEFPVPKRAWKGRNGNINIPIESKLLLQFVKIDFWLCLYQHHEVCHVTHVQNSSATLISSWIWIFGSAKVSMKFQNVVYSMNTAACKGCNLIHSFVLLIEQHNNAITHLLWKVRCHLEGGLRDNTVNF